MSFVYWLARGSSALVGGMPRPMRHSLGATVGAASYLGWRAKRHITQQNLSHVLSLPVSDARVKRAALQSWKNYGRYASDFLYFPHMNLESVEARLIDLTEGTTWQELGRQAWERGKGVIVPTAHFGSWDLAGALVAHHFPLFAVAETFRDPRLNAFLQKHRSQRNIGIIPMEGASRQILRVLQENIGVAIVVDRPMRKGSGVEITFFGQKTYVSGGPAALALRSGSSLIPGYVWYGQRHQLYMRAFAPIFPRVCEESEERDREIVRLTRLVYQTLEEVIRAAPTQWYMFRPFWPASVERS